MRILTNQILFFYRHIRKEDPLRNRSVDLVHLVAKISKMTTLGNEVPRFYFLKKPSKDPLNMNLRKRFDVNITNCDKTLDGITLGDIIYACYLKT